MFRPIDNYTFYRAYLRELSSKISFENNYNDYLFNNQILIQIVWLGYRSIDISYPARYFPESSPINFIKNLIYGIDCMITALKFRLSKCEINKLKLFKL